MKLIARTFFIILIAFLGHYYISANLNIKNMLTQVSQGDLTKAEVLKFYNKDFDPMLEIHQIFTPCLDHLISQEMKFDNFFSKLINSIKEIFSNSYYDFTIPELGMRIKCDTYINHLISPEYILKKKYELNELKNKILGINENLNIRDDKNLVSFGNKKLINKDGRGITFIEKTNKNNNYMNKHKLLNIEIKNQKNLEISEEQKNKNPQTKNEKNYVNGNNTFQIENHIVPQKLQKFNKNLSNKNHFENESFQEDLNKNKRLMHEKIEIQDQFINENSFKKINEKISIEIDEMKSSLKELSQKFNYENIEKLKCLDIKNRLEVEVLECKLEKAKLEINGVSSSSLFENKEIENKNIKNEDIKSNINKHSIIGNIESNNLDDIHNRDYAKLTDRLKICEEKGIQDKILILKQNGNITESQDKLNILISKIDKIEASNLEKEGELKNLQSEIDSQLRTYNKLKEHYDLLSKEHETTKKKIFEESDKIKEELNLCKKRESRMDNELLNAKENTNQKIQKNNELSKNLEILEKKLNFEIKSCKEEEGKIKKELSILSSKHKNIEDELISEKLNKQKCLDKINNDLENSKINQEAKISRMKEEQESIIKQLKAELDNLKNECADSKIKLKEKFSSCSKSLEYCEKEKTTKIKDIDSDLYNCKILLSKEKEEKNSLFIPITSCDKKIENVEKQINNIEAEYKLLKEKNLCPQCKESRENILQKDLDKISLKFSECEKNLNYYNNNYKATLNELNLLKNTLKSKEEKFKLDLETCNKDADLKIQVEKNNFEILKNKNEFEKKDLIEKYNKSRENEINCDKKLQNCNQFSECKEKLLICQKDNKQKEIKITEFESKIIMKNIDCNKISDNMNKCLETENNNKNKIIELENKAQKLTLEFEKINKNQREKDNQISDLIFEHKNKLLSELTNLGIIRAELEMKDRIIENYIVKLSEEKTIDQKNIEILIKQIEEKNKIIKDSTDLLNSSQKNLSILEKQKAEFYEKILKSERDADKKYNSLQKLTEDVTLIDKDLKKTINLIKNFEITIEKNKFSIIEINNSIKVFEKKKHFEKEDITNLESILIQYKEVKKKISHQISDNQNLIQNNSNKLNKIINNSVEAGTLNEKFDKRFAEFENQIKTFNIKISETKLKYQEQIKTLNDLLTQEKIKCIDEIHILKTSIGSTTFEDFKRVVNNRDEMDKYSYKYDLNKKLNKNNPNLL